MLKKPETAARGADRLSDVGRRRRLSSAASSAPASFPAGMEMMDTPAIHAAEDFVHAGYPLDVEALLIVELDGGKAEVDHLIDRVEAIGEGMQTPRPAVSRRTRRSGCCFWAGRKAAFPAVGRISPDYYCMDGTIPRARPAAWCWRACAR